MFDLYAVTPLLHWARNVCLKNVAANS